MHGSRVNDMDNLVFGPVPSRRFGRSLGVNTVPCKTCNYYCVYCQLDRTPKLQWERRVHFDAAAGGPGHYRHGHHPDGSIVDDLVSAHLIVR